MCIPAENKPKPVHLLITKYVDNGMYLVSALPGHCMLSNTEAVLPNSTFDQISINLPKNGGQ